MTWVLLNVLIICVLFSLTECYLIKHSAKPKFIRCRKDDTICLTLSAQQVYQNIIRGIPSLGIESSDPLYQKEISGILGKFQYNFTNVVTSGARGCVVQFLRFDNNLDNLKLNLLCSNFTVKGGYDIHGELIGRKVDEASKFILWSTSYTLKAIMKLDKVLGRDGKKYLAIADVKTNSTAQGPLRVKLENSKRLGTKSFDNDIWKKIAVVVGPTFVDKWVKEIAARKKFINDHQKEISVIVGLTFVVANVKEIAARTNIFLRSVPIDDLFLNFKLSCAFC